MSSKTSKGGVTGFNYNFSNARIMITGGTGSLGNAIAEKLLSSANPPSKIIIYSRDEQKQEQMARKFSCLDRENRLRFYIGDVRDEARLAYAMRDAQIVIHAAALKIVPAAERDPIEFIKTNIDGTKNVVQAAINTCQQVVCLVSTDKAVYPINLYGATKMVAEKLTLAANNLEGAKGPQFIVCRYGNVTGSRGSVIPLFLEQKSKGLPITITDTHMTRFWITLSDAADFVLQSVNQKRIRIMNQSLFVPYMPAYNILDLAVAIAGKDYSFEISGIRDGEKINERINTDEEFNLNDCVHVSSDAAYRLTVKELRKRLKKEGYLV